MLKIFEEKLAILVQKYLRLNARKRLRSNSNVGALSTSIETIEVID